MLVEMLVAALATRSFSTRMSWRLGIMDVRIATTSTGFFIFPPFAMLDTFSTAATCDGSCRKLMDRVVNTAVRSLAKRSWKQN